MMKIGKTPDGETFILRSLTTNPIEDKRLLRRRQRKELINRLILNNYEFASIDIQSNSRINVFHTITIEDNNVRCSCESYRYRRQPCIHMKELDLVELYELNRR